jgi:hypothetical protein
MDRTADAVPTTCDRCGQAIHPGRGDCVAVGIVAVADPWPPIITEDELTADVGREIQLLIDRLSRRTERALEDDVVRRVAFTLCRACFSVWIADPLDRGTDEAG